MEDLMMEKEEKVIVPVCEKYTLTIKEAAAYFNIGIKKMRRLAEENTSRCVYTAKRSIFPIACL